MIYAFLFILWHNMVFGSIWLPKAIRSWNFLTKNIFQYLEHEPMFNKFNRKKTISNAWEILDVVKQGLRWMSHFEGVWASPYKGMSIKVIHVFLWCCRGTLIVNHVQIGCFRPSKNHVWCIYLHLADFHTWIFWEHKKIGVTWKSSRHRMIHVSRIPNPTKWQNSVQMEFLEKQKPTWVCFRVSG